MLDPKFGVELLRWASPATQWQVQEMQQQEIFIEHLHKRAPNCLSEVESPEKLAFRVYIEQNHRIIISIFG